ncbi:MAG: peptidoglycan DD-metalloendopeptidase family protein [Candidatus Omnitrophica bacterium]|jgi:murein DD-endopeptidase MepM/ murein hydrolase activator NlpD|nr:peptidoglycan DD-metalloendopeptidase family protein [Candidatus Omnitrophota bacterium]MDD5691063.1 peptidoglycan DD-metalloendopeptidase family protein [Candidatus Omnitrophota bacterium]
MKNIILILMILAVSGCVSNPTYTGPRAPVSPQLTPGLRHRVEPKQTLWRISRMYNVDIDDILRANNISEDATIEIGQVLIIPNRLKPRVEKVFFSGDDFIWPLKGKIIAGFGTNYQNLINKGINIQVFADTDILASRSGRVVFYAVNLGNFGRTIIIDHGNGLRSVYSRASEFFVRPGESVQRGALIGRINSTVKGKNNYFHFEIRKGAMPQNPLFYLP